MIVNLNLLPVQTVTITMKAPNIQIFFPKVIRLPNPSVEAHINQTIYNEVQSMIKAQGYHQDPANTEMQGSYEIKTNERGILSLSLSNYTYIKQHAHGLTLLKSLTCDVESGKFYTLKELFKPGSDYVKRLSALVAAQIKQRQIELLAPFQAIRPDQDFYIADKALVIYFQLYEITPYYYGFPAFPISVYDIQDIILENGPLGIMLPT